MSASSPSVLNYPYHHLQMSRSGGSESSNRPVYELDGEGWVASSHASEMTDTFWGRKRGSKTPQSSRHCLGHSWHGIITADKDQNQSLPVNIMIADEERWMAAARRGGWQLRREVDAAESFHQHCHDENSTEDACSL
jgi:hypothetical protein